MRFGFLVGMMEALIFAVFISCRMAENQLPAQSPVAAVLQPAEVGIAKIDYGHMDTPWAKRCPQGSTYHCVAGDFAVQNPTSPAMSAVQYTTAHFALRYDNGVFDANQSAQLGNTLERIWSNHVDTIGFIEPYCYSPKKFKVNVQISPNSGLYGSGTGSVDPAIWIGPTAISNLWGLAHEFTHSLQFASGGLRSSPYTGWFWEAHAEYMAHTLPDWGGIYKGCTELSVNFPHIYLGSTRDRYCAWQFLDYLKDVYCNQAVNQLWTEAPSYLSSSASVADPFSTLAQTMHFNATQLNDFFGMFAMHNITWDYRDPDGTCQGEHYRAFYGPMTDRLGGAFLGARYLRTTQLTTIDAKKRRFAVASYWAPQRWGYNLVPLFPDAGAKTVTVIFKGLVQMAPATTQMPLGDLFLPTHLGKPESGWRWGLVAVDSNGTQARYSTLQRATNGALTFAVHKQDSALWLMVMATPQSIQKIEWDQRYYAVYRYPWMVELVHAYPSGDPVHTPHLTKGGTIWPNGGGWVDANAMVDASVYVAPTASILSGTVKGHAKIIDHALVANANIGDHAVIAGLSVVAGGIAVDGNAVVHTTFQGPGSFESNQHLGGSGQLWGDIELRGGGLSIDKGVFFGFDDSNAAQDPNQGSTRQSPPAEITASPPTSW